MNNVEVKHVYHKQLALCGRTCPCGAPVRVGQTVLHLVRKKRRIVVHTECLRNVLDGKSDLFIEQQPGLERCYYAQCCQPQYGVEMFTLKTAARGTRFFGLHKICLRLILDEAPLNHTPVQEECVQKLLDAYV